MVGWKRAKRCKHPLKLAPRTDSEETAPNAAALYLDHEHGYQPLL